MATFRRARWAGRRSASCTRWWASRWRWSCWPASARSWLRGWRRSGGCGAARGGRRHGARSAAWASSWAAWWSWWSCRPVSSRPWRDGTGDPPSTTPSSRCPPSASAIMWQVGRIPFTYIRVNGPFHKSSYEFFSLYEFVDPVLNIGVTNSLLLRIVCLFTLGTGLSGHGQEPRFIR